MARSIDEINIGNFTDTGLTSSINRYTFDLEIKWTDDAGVKRTNGPLSHVWPNELAAMPLAVRKRFAIDMITATVRVVLGIAQWSDYE
jgi:hypothetical protein